MVSVLFYHSKANGKQTASFLALLFFFLLHLTERLYLQNIISLIYYFLELESRVVVHPNKTIQQPNRNCTRKQTGDKNTFLY